MITYLLYEDFSVREAAEIVMKNRLFVPGWLMHGLMKRVRDSPNSWFDSSRIAIAYDKGTPIGVGFYYQQLFASNPRVQSFVRKRYRRQGIGSALVNKVKKDEVPFAYHGVDGSDKFWNSVGVCVIR